ncbi:MAG: hypothetical protein NTU88_09645 [Armatimonadetes bacterium]|nr:hypothetical protein [Armatimonadota bacterium]
MNILVTKRALVHALLVGICLLQPLACQGENVLLIQPSSPWSVTGKDDIQQLKRLASGVGWEFEPNAETTAGLRAIGIKTIRCINVDPLPGKFDKAGKFVISDEPNRLLQHLQTCREIGADPHIIVATGLHPDLRVMEEDIPASQRGLLGNQTKTTVFGPKDWGKFQHYCEAYFEYVLITHKFPQAVFEVANEPDIGGAMYPMPPKPAMGSRALYDAYFALYTNVAKAAQRFEAEHPGVKVQLSGPGGAWAYSFRFGDFNWAERFLADCHRDHLKLDSIGLHFYGNCSSIDGEYAGAFPSFTEMLHSTKSARDRYCPNVPIRITEWGASYQTSNSPPARINGNHIGAAWSAAFLNTMLNSGVDAALYLVTTDHQQQGANGAWENVWGWPSLFVNPVVFGGHAYPKAPYHVFDMVARLAGTRVEATRGEKTVNCIASVDAQDKRITVLVWNHAYQIPERPVGTENAQREAVTLRIREAERFFGGQKVTMERWLVSETVSNAEYLFTKEGKIDDRCRLQRVDQGDYSVVDGLVDIGFALPPSSVSLVVMTAAR